jgi:tetratricopeptide (TPR) repeat protein
MSKDDRSPSELADKAMQAYKQNRIKDAIVGFSEAREIYLQNQEFSKAAEMANSLCVALLKDGRADEAFTVVEGTPQIFLDLGEEVSAAMAYGNLASALEACGKLSEAESALEEAARRFQQLGQKEYYLDTQRALSQLRLRQARPLEALSAMQAGLEKQSRLNIGHRILRSLLSIPGRLLNR